MITSAPSLSPVICTRILPGLSAHCNCVRNDLSGAPGTVSSLPVTLEIVTFGFSTDPSARPSRAAFVPADSLRGTGDSSRLWSCITSTALVTPFFTREVTSP